MGSAVGEILPLGIGVAVSPFPIITVILMLFTRRARGNASAFLAGWVIGLVIVGVIVLVISNRVDVAADGEPWTGESALRSVAGVLLLVLAWRQWRRRPEEGGEKQVPRWMQQVESMNPAIALGLGAVLSGLNPKDTTLTILAAATIARAGLSAGESALTLTVFIVIATFSVVVPVTLYFALGERAEETLNGWKAWLTEHNSTVLVVLFLVFGIVLVVQGIRGLAI